MSNQVTTSQIKELMTFERAVPGGILPHLLVIAIQRGGDADCCSTMTHALEQLLALEEDRYQAEQIGLGAEVQNLIDRLTASDPARSEDVRIWQAKVLWELHFGDMLGLGPHEFQKYLTGTGTGTDSLEPIPEIPVWPMAYPDYLNRNVLVDERVLAKANYETICWRFGVKFAGPDKFFRPFEEDHTQSGVYWIRAQGGRRNRGKNPQACRTERFADCEIGLEVFQGLSLLAQDRDVVGNNHIMDLPGTVHTAFKGNYCVRLGWWPRYSTVNELQLGGHKNDHDDPHHGSASRGK